MIAIHQYTNDYRTKLWGGGLLAEARAEEWALYAHPKSAPIAFYIPRGT